MGVGSRTVTTGDFGGLTVVPLDAGARVGAGLGAKAANLARRGQPACPSSTASCFRLILLPRSPTLDVKTRSTHVPSLRCASAGAA